MRVVMRVNSFIITRNHCAFGGISSPNSFSHRQRITEIVGHGAEVIDAIGKAALPADKLGLARLLGFRYGR